MSETTKTREWQPSLHHVEKQHAILFSQGHADDREMVSFSVFTNKKPFVRVKRISVVKKHFWYSIIAKDRRPVKYQEDKSILFVLCTTDDQA